MYIRKLYILQKYSNIMINNKYKLGGNGTEFYLYGCYSFFSERPIRKFINNQIGGLRK